MLSTPSPPPAQRRLPIPARALPKARGTPEAWRILDAFLELHRHGCGEWHSLDRGPPRVERHHRLVDCPSRPRCIRARPPRNEAGAPWPRPACHRWGVSPKSAAAARTHLPLSPLGSVAKCTAALRCRSPPRPPPPASPGHGGLEAGLARVAAPRSGAEKGAARTTDTFREDRAAGRTLGVKERRDGQIKNTFEATPVSAK